MYVQILFCKREGHSITVNYVLLLKETESSPKSSLRSAFFFFFCFVRKREAKIDIIGLIFFIPPRNIHFRECMTRFRCILFSFYTKSSYLTKFAKKGKNHFDPQRLPLHLRCSFITNLTLIYRRQKKVASLEK